MDKQGYKFYLEAELKPVTETVALKQEVAAVVTLPNVKDRQPDLSYFSSIFVSTGTNLNNAHFLPSELVMAENTVIGKAVDIEHEEEQIIGHIYSSAFTDQKGNALDLNELKSKELSSLDKQDMHIEIASVIYKTRFPELAQEVADGEWKVSMEAYYGDFDIMVGDTILSKDEAMSLGFDVANEANYGKSAQIVKAGKVIAEGILARVLRNICFSGVGIVKSPANQPSIVLEATASTKDTPSDIITLDYDTINKDSSINVTSSNIGDLPSTPKEISEMVYDDTVGVCVNYSKEVLDTVVKDQDTKVLKENWCSKFDRNCTVSGEATSPNCLIYTVSASVQEVVNIVYKDNKISDLTDKLISILKR